MFIKSDIFDRLLCCRKKVMIDDDNDDKVEEEMVLQHTNNNKTEFITSSQLLQRLKGGTTAVVALIREKRLVVAWLGDSQALLVRKRNPVQIVHPHRPELETERKRIEAQGGCVVNIQGTWRVLGQLAVSRAIGDLDHKPYVSSECDIKSLEISGDEDFLILACDGLWDTLQPENAVNIVYSYLRNNAGDTDGVGRCLVEAARVAGSEDNITAVVVFLRPVNVLMDEESARIEQGQVPEMESFVMTTKDSLPPSINAIFSQPSNLNPESPAFTPFEQANGGATLPLKNGNIESPQDDVIRTDILPKAAAPLEVIIHDSDSDEGVGEEIAIEKASQKSPAAAESAPTEEEVDAALAELDSLPDGAGDTGDVDEEDEDWAYYKMEPQNDAPKEDLIAQELSQASEPIEAVTKVESPAGSPRGGGAGSPPRAVEGFVTSVELNTPEESYNTNVTINQSTDFLNGGGSVLEQNSGPFSVYVSSSPEPLSMETPPVRTQATINDDADEQKEDLPYSPVEIVHAQSTVEVSPALPDILADRSSLTEELPPTEPYIASPDVALCRETSPTIVQDAEETARNFDELVSQAKQFEDSLLVAAPAVTFDPLMPEHAPVSFDHANANIASEHPAMSEESTLLINELENTVNEVSSVIVADSSPSFEEVKPTEALDFIMEDEEENKSRFTHEITKAFNEPLDEMLVSYHEDQNPLSEVMASNRFASQEESDLMNATEEILAEKVSQIKLEVSATEEQILIPEITQQVEEEPSVEPVTPAPPVVVEEVKKRVESKATPPKPSPRTVSNKSTAVLKPKATAPLPASRTTTTAATKKPTVASRAPAATKPTAPKPSSARSRPATSSTGVAAARTTSATTSRLAARTGVSQTASRSKSMTATTTTTKTTTAARTKVTSSTSTKPSTIPPTRSSNVSTATPATKRVPLSARTSSATTKPATSRTQNTTAAAPPKPRVAPARPASGITAKTSRISTTTTTTKAKSTTSTTTTTRKPLSTTSSTPRPISSTLSNTRPPAATKDTKNTTNKLLSSARTATTTRPASAKTATAGTRPVRTTPSKTNKTPTLKTKTPEVKKKVEPSLMNGEENKIMEEESSVEIKEKIVEEEQKQELISTEEGIKTEVLVNGDH